MKASSDPAVSAPPPPHRPRRRIDRFLSSSLTDGPVAPLRQARLVAWSALGSILLFTYGAVSLAGTNIMESGSAEPALFAVGLSTLVPVLGLALLRFRGQVILAAWFTTLTLGIAPAVQAALDLGLSDPVLPMASLAPLVAAMVSGTRMSVVNAIVAVAALSVLLAMQLAGYPFPNISSDAAIQLYAYLVPATLAVLSAMAGVLYVRHSNGVLADAEAYATNLSDQLRDSEHRFRSLFMEIPLGLCRSKPDGSIVMANPSLASILGARDIADVLTLNLNDLYVDPLQRVDFQKRIAETGTVRQFEANWRRRSGEIRTVRIGAYMIPNADGSPAFYEGTAEDITAERRARTELHRSEARFRALVNRSSDLTVVIDKLGRISYASPSALHMLGHDPANGIGMRAFDVIHPEDRAEFESLFNDVLHRNPDRTVPAAPYELRVQHKSGHYVFLEGVGSIMFNDPAVGGLVINLRDITERKRAQAVLLQAKRQAEEVAHLKSTFMANMSHEIRTPLTGILGFADVLASEVTDPEHREFVELIASSGRRLMDTLNSVLDLARLESGRSDLALVPISVSGSVLEAVALMQGAARDRDLTLEAVVADRVEALLDDAAFARVLHNLIGNALKFTREGGVTVAVAMEPGLVQVAVRDTGIGIDPAFLPRLFGEFEQASTGVERTHEGAGLGLAISRQLVEKMGGTIKVESTLGSGSTFTLSFPLITEHAKPAPPDTRPRVLVVDDNDQALLVAERILEEFYRVETAVDGPGALAAVESDRPDAVLLDIHLGDGISGEDIMRKLRSVPGNDDMPILAITAYALPGDRARFIAAGFDDYMTKPYTRRDLLDMLAGAQASRHKPADAPMIVTNRHPAEPAPVPQAENSAQH